MIRYERAKPKDYAKLMDMMNEHAADYLETTLRLMGIDEEEFLKLFANTGETFNILADDQFAGFYWIEKRDRILHIHGIVLDNAFQGQGIGKRVFKDLEDAYQKRADIMELGVHKTNEKAMQFYKQNGFSLHKELDELSFLILRKPLK